MTIEEITEKNRPRVCWRWETWSCSDANLTVLESHFGI